MISYGVRYRRLKSTSDELRELWRREQERHARRMGVILDRLRATNEAMKDLLDELEKRNVSDHRK